MHQLALPHQSRKHPWKPHQPRNPPHVRLPHRYYFIININDRIILFRKPHHPSHKSRKPHHPSHKSRMLHHPSHESRMPHHPWMCHKSRMPHHPRMSHQWYYFIINIIHWIILFRMSHHLSHKSRIPHHLSHKSRKPHHPWMTHHSSHHLTCQRYYSIINIIDRIILLRMTHPPHSSRKQLHQLQQPHHPSQPHLPSQPHHPHQFNRSHQFNQPHHPLVQNHCQNWLQWRRFQR